MKYCEFKNGQTLLIREAVKKDAPGIIQYLYEIASESDFLTFGEGEISISVSEEEAFIEASAQTDNRLFIVAEINGKIVACLNFTGDTKPRKRHTGEFGVSVLRAYWDLGIGTQLVKYLISWAQASNVIRKINLRVREDNHRAIKLYSKLGFIKEGIITREFLVDGKFYDAVFMGLQID
ncbi:MAG: GNAT family N-acetyltransferase [Peptococcaceae bacterium]|nr:GNAT family N-acetyltransferase [Peptococcaceae bacterium]